MSKTRNLNLHLFGITYRKECGNEGNEKLYKVYHRNYKNIEELYDDLSDAILDVSLENNRIIIHYNSDK